MAYLSKLTPEEKKEHYKRVAAKRRATIEEKYGAGYWSNIGKIGGKASSGYEFAHGKISPSEASKARKK